MQFGMWVFDELHPEASAYNNPAAILLKGTLDVRAMELALEQLHQRHELLRARVDDSDDMPHLVCDVSAPAMEVSKLALPEFEARELLTTKAQERFDLASGPLWRASLQPLVDGDHVLLLVLHHIISDGWSLGVLFHELSAIYGALATGATCSLPAPPDNVMALLHGEWELSAARREHTRQFWTSELAGSSVRAELPRDLASTTEDAEGSSVVGILAENDTVRLESICAGVGASAVAGWVAAFVSVVHSFSAQEDIVFAMPVARRLHSRSLAAVGCFLTTVPVRVRVDPSRRGRDLIADCGAAIRRSIAHFDLPIAEIMATGPSGGSLPNLMCVENNASSGEGRLGELDASRFELAVPGVKNDWAMMSTRTKHGLRLEIEYRKNAFTAETMTVANGRLLSFATALGTSARPTRTRTRQVDPSDRRLALPGSGSSLGRCDVLCRQLGAPWSTEQTRHRPHV